MEILVIIHLLAACVWVGGSIALVVVGVPTLRTLDGEPRNKAMSELGKRWRPLGYGALITLAVTGAILAQHDLKNCTSPFKAVLWVKVALAVALVIVSYLHSYVLGPRLQREIREGRPQVTRPSLIAVGWTSLALTITLPILGAILAHLS
jgi:putative copper export protein